MDDLLKARNNKICTNFSCLDISGRRSLYTSSLKGIDGDFTSWIRRRMLIYAPDVRGVPKKPGIDGSLCMSALLHES